MNRALGIAAVAAAVVLSSGAASAAGHANGFGEKGQLILSADRLLPVFNYTTASVTRTEPGTNIELTTSKSGANVSLLLGRNVAIDDSGATVPVNVHTIPRIAFDVTVVRRLTLGAAIAFGFGLGGTNTQESVVNGAKVSRERDEPTLTAIGLVPRVGYVLPLSDVIAFWPRGGIGFYSVSASREETDNNGVITTAKATDTLLSLDLDPQFALVPLEHFFLHAGPLLNVPITGSRSTSTTTGTTTTKRSDDASVVNIGLSAGLGGWFDVF